MVHIVGIVDVVAVDDGRVLVDTVLDPFAVDNAKRPYADCVLDDGGHSGEDGDERGGDGDKRSNHIHSFDRTCLASNQNPARRMDVRLAMTRDWHQPT